MKLLLDTHALLWWLADDSRLSSKARKLIAQAQCEGLHLVSIDSQFLAYDVDVIW